jgi:phage I-like protein
MGRFRAGDGSGRPERLPEGWNLTPQGAARLAARFEARKNRLVIDYEHQSFATEKNGQPAPAAGWVGRLDVRADGLYADDVEWTARAAKMIADKEYRYISPVFLHDPKTGDVRALLNAALVNLPGLDGLTDLAALAAQVPIEDFEEEETPMKELLKALGLTERASEAEALDALKAIRDAQTGEIAALKAASPDPSKYVGIAVMEALKTELTAAGTELAALKAEKLAAEVDAVVKDALAAKKLVPALEPWAKEQGVKDLVALKTYIENAPVIPCLDGTQSGGKPPTGTRTAATADSIAQAALKYQTEQANVGIAVTAAAAVAHVTKGA